ncbi:unnamed protein product [Cuscuta europaea]|uniref:Uncharacterized protein n=1 Tax=Cuscuta europaea TaxID=41803 RepID=A0A9P0ZT78_CUSEU|nr:unnamed protein product [Cuscuta europaea]
MAPELAPGALKTGLHLKTRVVSLAVLASLSRDVLVCSEETSFGQKFRLSDLGSSVSLNVSFPFVNEKTLLDKLASFPTERELLRGQLAFAGMQLRLPQAEWQSRTASLHQLSKLV